MTRTLLLNSSSQRVEVNEGEAAVCTFTFYDTSGSAIAKSAIQTLTCSLTNAADGATINSRSGQNVLDANDGTLSTAGVLTLKLGASDNTIVGSNTQNEELHYLTLNWTWTDGDGDTLTGQQDFELWVQPDTTGNGIGGVGWLV